MSPLSVGNKVQLLNFVVCSNSWLTENQGKPDFIQGLLRKSAEDRIVMAVDNPCYIPRNKPLIKTFKDVRGSFQENLSER